MRYILSIAFIFLASPAFAYIGPGAAITLLGTVLGFSSLVLLGTVFTVTWPIWLVVKYIRKKRNIHKNEAASKTTHHDDGP